MQCNQIYLFQKLKVKKKALKKITLSLLMFLLRLISIITEEGAPKPTNITVKNKEQVLLSSQVHITLDIFTFRKH
jgi:hypothetical protein